MKLKKVFNYGLLGLLFVNIFCAGHAMHINIRIVVPSCINLIWH